MDNKELAEIGKLVAELTKHKLEVTPHLDIGNFSCELFGRLLDIYSSRKDQATCSSTIYDIKIK